MISLPKPRTPKERKMRFDLRKKAQQSINDVTHALEKISKLHNSEKDYALIFQDDKFYFDMLKACNSAYSESYKSLVKIRQNPEEFLDALQVYSMRVGLRVHSKKQLLNQRYQNKVIAELRKNPNEYQSFCRYIIRLVAEKPEKKIQESFKKELQQLRDNSDLIDLYSERKNAETALRIAARVYGKLLEDDKEFLAKPLEQIKSEYLNENGSA